jgi:hypothetical protein
MGGTQDLYWFGPQESNCRGSLPPTVNFYRSCVGLECLVQETTEFILVGPARSNTLRPVCSYRVLEPGVLVVGVTSWSGEGVRTQVPGGGVWSYERRTLVTVSLLSLL